MKDTEFKELLQNEEIKDALMSRILDDVPQDIGDVEFSDEYLKRKEALLKSYGITDEPPKTRKIIYRAASIILVVVVALGVMSLSVRAFFPQVWRVFVDWFEDYSSVSFDIKRGEKSSELEELMEPTYVPEGLEVGEVYDTADTHVIEYVANGKSIIDFSQELSLNESSLIDNSYVFEPITIKNNSGYIGANGATRIITWDDGTYRYRFLFSVHNISEEIVLKMSESIYAE